MIEPHVLKLIWGEHRYIEITVMRDDGQSWVTLDETLTVGGENGDDTFWCHKMTFDDFENRLKPRTGP